MMTRNVYKTYFNQNMSFSFTSYQLLQEKKKFGQRITQDEMFDFMSDMAQNMIEENIPIVNNLVNDFPGLDKKEKEKTIDNSDNGENGDNDDT